MKKIKLTENDYILIRDGGKTLGCGSVNKDGLLYLIDKNEMTAICLPEKYKDTPIYLYYPCGGYNEGLIMVSLLGEIDLKYHHQYIGTAGMWGWINIDGDEVISPQYVFAMTFYKGKAIVCKGDWTVDEQNKYWCENEQWGIIDKTGKEIVPCKFDKISDIADSERYVLCHKNGWKNGSYVIYDIEQAKEIVEVNFEYDTGYMFNDCVYENDCIYFDVHEPGGEKDYIYVFSLTEGKWIVHGEVYEDRTINGESKIVVNKDEKDIIVF